MSQSEAGSQWMWLNVNKALKRGSVELLCCAWSWSLAYASRPPLLNIVVSPDILQEHPLTQRTALCWDMSVSISHRQTSSFLPCMWNFRKKKEVEKVFLQLSCGLWGGKMMDADRPVTKINHSAAKAVRERAGQSSNHWFSSAARIYSR